MRNNYISVYPKTYPVVQASSLPSVLHMEMQGFADNHMLRNSFELDDKQDQQTKIKDMEGALQDTQKWMNAMWLKLNPDKTEFILIDNQT